MPYGDSTAYCKEICAVCEMVLGCVQKGGGGKRVRRPAGPGGYGCEQKQRTENIDGEGEGDRR